MTGNVTCLATKVPRVSLSTVKFVGIFGFSVSRGGQITTQLCREKKTENNSRLFKRRKSRS